MSKANDLLDLLVEACTSGGTAIRVVTTLAPAGGAADKVFAPTYATDTKGVSTYAVERRALSGGGEDTTVLLDSVQSQANRMEQALKEWWEADETRLPMLVVQVPSGNRTMEITALDAPHRAADAIFRDSEHDGKPFRDSSLGQRFVRARPDDATSLFGICPTALVFGQWDSTADAGTAGAKFQRIVVSEITGFGAVQGKRTSSRIDPLRIEKDAVEIYEAVDGFWTFDPKRARKDKKDQPVKSKPSEVNHGNVLPTVSDMGGFSVRRAEQVTVLSFPALRRLRFPAADGTRDIKRDAAARTVLAALALHALCLMQEHGYDLRSRCLLQVVERHAEYLGATASDGRPLALDPDLTEETLRLAVEQARRLGLPWEAGRLPLEPSVDLVKLVALSVNATEA